jgi:predicted DNA-binding ribbon-helix-helix protein
MCRQRRGYGVESNHLIVRKRSIVVAGRKTSVSLEEPFWICLKEIAAIKNITLRDLIADIRCDGAANLSSAMRLFVLEYYRSLDMGPTHRDRGRLMPRQLRQPWKPEEDEILLELVKAGKSWVLISAKLKRTIEHTQLRYRVLRRRSAALLRSSD